MSSVFSVPSFHSSCHQIEVLKISFTVKSYILLSLFCDNICLTKFPYIRYCKYYCDVNLPNVYSSSFCPRRTYTETWKANEQLTNQSPCTRLFLLANIMYCIYFIRKCSITSTEQRPLIKV
jgi:hypothetical protein